MDRQGRRRLAHDFFRRSGTGFGTIGITAAPSDQTSTREVRVTVADQSLRLLQRGRAACEFTFSPDDLHFGASGASGTIEVVTSAGCGWTAATDKSWRTLTPTSGTGSGHIAYKAGAYDGDSPRTARIAIADRSINVRQDPRARDCEYSSTPADVVQHWHHDSGVTR